MLEFLSFLLAVPTGWRRCQGERREQAGAITAKDVPMAVGWCWRQLDAPVTLRTISVRRWLRRASSRAMLEQDIPLPDAQRLLAIVKPNARRYIIVGVVCGEAVVQIPAQLAVVELS